MKTTLMTQWRRLTCYACLAAWTLLPAWAAQRLPVTSVKPLLLQAITHGESHGVLVGESASFMRGRFESAAPIEIDVKTLGSLRKAGCKRLEVTTRQNAVRETPKQAPAPKELVYQVSYCRDGRFPEAD